ncbi:MAG: PAS domain S-box protein [Thermodesulfovibrionales bacterium]
MTERKHAKEIPPEERKFAETLIEHSAVATFVLNTDHTILVWNRACSELTGFPSSQMIGTDNQWKPFYDQRRSCLADVVLGADSDGMQELYSIYGKSALSPGALYSEGWYQNLNGKDRYIMFEAAPVYDSNGNLIAAIETLQDITERKHAEALRESEDKFRNLAERSLVGIYLIQDSLFRYVNPRLAEIFGYTVEELLHKKGPKGLVLEEDWPLVEENFLKRLSGEVEASHYGFRGITKQRETISVEVYGTRLVYQGRPAVIGTLLDITEKKAALEEVRQKEIHLQGVLDCTVDGILAVDHKGKIIKANKKFADLWRIPRSIIDTGDDNTMLTLVLDQLIDPDAFINKVRRLYGTEDIDKDVLFFKDGRVFERYSAPLIEKGSIIGRIWSFTDVTERKHAEDALRLSEERFRLAMLGANDGLWDWNLLTDEVYYSPRWKSMLGYSEEELENHLDTWKCMVHPDDREPTLSFVRDILEERADKFEIQFRMRHKEGHYRDILSRAFLLRDEQFKPLRLVGTHVDITERKEAEGKLRKSEEAYRRIVESMSEGIWSLDDQYRTTFVNTAMAEMLAYTREEMIGTPIEKYIFDEDFEDHRLRREARRKGINEHFERRYRRKNGDTCWCLVSAAPLQDSEGQFVGSFVICTDITKRKEVEESLRKSEEQFRQAQKMEAIGQLAGGVAHDFNNILSAIIGYSQLAQMKIQENDPVRHDIDQILQASERATVLTQSLLAFSRKQPVNLAAIDLSKVISGFEKFLLRLIREDINLKTNPSSDTLSVMADRGQIEQVIMNLVANARDAMPNGGQLAISTELTSITDAFIKTHGFGKPGQYALMSVSDTGTGMDEKTKSRIFEPFYTTKELGRGTGLGLAMVYGIVKKHDGFIAVYSEPGEGTTFKIYFPIVRTAAKPGNSTIAEPVAPKRGTESILVAEDDAALRSMYSAMLSQYGYGVIEAVDGTDAVLKFMQNADKIQLVILDGIMPRMNGKEAFAKIKSLRPGIKCLFMSGYTEDVSAINSAHDNKVDFMLKPVAMEKLLKKIRDLLDK